jgi:hypothetical protein
MENKEQKKEPSAMITRQTSNDATKLANWLLSVEKRAFDPRMLRIESYRQLESELIDPNECQSTGERWNQENKRQECYLIDIESDRVFCLSRTSTNSRWDLDFEVDFSSVL